MAHYTQDQTYRGLISVAECVASEPRTLPDCYLTRSNEVMLQYFASDAGLLESELASKDVYKKPIE